MRILLLALKLLIPQFIQFQESAILTEPIVVCEAAHMGTNQWGGLDDKWYEVKNCPALSGEKVTQLINSISEQHDKDTHCGEWGPWIVDKHNVIMGKYKNPPCPKGQ